MLNKSITMSLKHTYNEITIVHFVNLTNEMSVVVSSSKWSESTVS